MIAGRRYYDDSYTTRFEARIVRRGTHQGREAVALAETWFYPESGGQLADRGEIAGAPVIDVQATEDGVVWHVVEAAPMTESGEARLDWGRRFDHMQQHTGQHVLSAAFERVRGAATLSSTLGAEKSVIEVALPDVSWPDVAAVEAAANAVVWEDRALALHWSDAEGAKRFALRKALQVAGPVRIVEIPDWDVSACGGTHVRRTGEVGVIKVLRWEKLRGHLRFEFLCGGRVVRDHAWRNEAMLEAAKRRSIADRELIAHLERAADERDQLRKQLAAVSERMVTTEAAALARTSPAGVRAWFRERPRDEVRLLAIKAVEAGAAWSAVAAGAPAPVLVVAAARGGRDLKAILPRLLDAARGKGGGSPELLQVAAADAAAAVAALDAAAAALG